MDYYNYTQKFNQIIDQNKEIIANQEELIVISKNNNIFLGVCSFAIVLALASCFVRQIFY